MHSVRESSVEMRAGEVPSCWVNGREGAIARSLSGVAELCASDPTVTIVLLLSKAAMRKNLRREGRGREQAPRRSYAPQPGKEPARSRRHVFCSLAKRRKVAVSDSDNLRTAAPSRALVSVVTCLLTSRRQLRLRWAVRNLNLPHDVDWEATHPASPNHDTAALAFLALLLARADHAYQPYGHG